MIWFIMALYGLTWFYVMTYMVYIHYKFYVVSHDMAYYGFTMGFMLGL